MLQKEHTGQEFIYPDKYAGLNVDHRRSASTPEDVVFRDKAAIMIAPYPTTRRTTGLLAICEN